MLDVRCEQCGTQLRLGDEWAGKKGRCPRCRHVLMLPQASSPQMGLPLSPESEVAAQSVRQSLPNPPDTSRWNVRGSKYWLAAGMAGVLVLILALLGIALRGEKDPAEPVAAVTRVDAAPVEPATPAHIPEQTSSPSTVMAQPSSEIASLPQPANASSAASQERRVRPSSRSRSQPPPRASGGLVGVSREYDDIHCQQIQLRYAVRIPAAATILEVDGVRLPVAHPGSLAERPAPLLMLPRGRHSVRFRTSDMPVEIEIDKHLLDEYEAMRKFFGLPGSIRTEELISRGARAFDVHGAPFLLNLEGAAQAKADQWDVAERQFRRALCVNPTFSPAHLNLAECLLRRNDREQAIREVLLAEAFNVGDVYGLSAALNQYRRKLGIGTDAREPADAAATSYVSTEPMSQQDHRLVAVLEGASKYAVRPEDRAKILNNLAIHFADSKRPELALYYFREALGTAKIAGPERFTLAMRILANMADTCRDAGFAEANSYQRMQQMVTP
jgi:tetratricopeptide (TPR) repeat protein/DNA-directed RNA polymerase subunit RPC12/RpoP